MHVTTTVELRARSRREAAPQAPPILASWGEGAGHGLAETDGCAAAIRRVWAGATRDESVRALPGLRRGRLHHDLGWQRARRGHLRGLLRSRTARSDRRSLE